MCPGVDAASNNEYRDNPEGKGGLCVRLTTYHLHLPTVNKPGGLNLLEPFGPVQACNGTALYLHNAGSLFYTRNNTSHSLQVFQSLCVMFGQSPATISVTLTVPHGQHTVYCSLSRQFNSHLFCSLCFISLYPFPIHMHCSFRRQVMMLKMLMAVLHMVNLQNTSLCCTTFNDVNNTHSLIKVLEIRVLVFTVLCIVCTVIVLFHLCYLFVLSVLV